METQKWNTKKSIATVIGVISYIAAIAGIPDGMAKWATWLQPIFDNLATISPGRWIAIAIGTLMWALVIPWKQVIGSLKKPIHIGSAQHEAVKMTQAMRAERDSARFHGTITKHDATVELTEHSKNVEDFFSYGDLFVIVFTVPVLQTQPLSADFSGAPAGKFIIHKRTNRVIAFRLLNLTNHCSVRLAL